MYKFSLEIDLKMTVKEVKAMDYYEDSFETELKKLDKNKDYYLYCKVGGRSGSVANLMHTNGFIKVHDLLGGFDAWETSGLPITLTDD